jgi:hypothetical protein
MNSSRCVPKPFDRLDALEVDYRIYNGEFYAQWPKKSMKFLPALWPKLPDTAIFLSRNNNAIAAN